MKKTNLMRSRSRVCVAAALACLWAAAAGSAPDPYISQMTAQVDRAEVEPIIQTLQDFGTRHTLTPESDAAADWIRNQMASFGLSPFYETFTVGVKQTQNVIARLDGVVTPDRVFIIGAHYDSISTAPATNAPGADDNASGVAAVLSAASILSLYRFENTVEFIAFGGEEQGCRGSEINAAQAVAAGKNVVGMVNLDMIAYWPAPPGSDRELDIGRNDASLWLANAMEQAAIDYATIPVHKWPDTGMCFDDQAEYWNQGYDAIVLMDCYEAHMGMSGESTPHYHQTTDTIATLDLDQTTEAVRAAVGLMAVLAVPVVPRGACCEDGGICNEVGDLDCVGGTWRGEGTTCFADCAWGACCEGTACTPDRLQSACEAASGLYQGDGTTCSPDPCVPIGACCEDGGTCREVSDSACAGVGGTWRGDGTTCAADCAWGACCEGTTCTPDRLQSACEAATGTYQGDGATCSPDPCTPIGACCEDGGTCREVSDSACAGVGGTWRGDGTTCAADCAWGACCEGTTCTPDRLQSACEAATGTYQGDGATCSPDPCTPACTPSNLASVGNHLLVLRSGATRLDLEFHWVSPGDEGVQCNVNYVDTKGDISGAHRQAAGIEACTGSVPDVICTLGGGVGVGDTDLYFQVFSACGDLGSQEGPF